MEDNKAILDRQAFERFAVKYWGQEVSDILVVGCGILTKSINEHTINEVKCLQLRSIDSLTDEELIKAIGQEGYVGEFQILSIGVPVKDYLSDNINTLFSSTVDYLRSIGILVPADGYTVEEILEMGWAKY